MTFGSYEIGVIQRTPIPDLTGEEAATLAALAHRAWSLKRNLDTITQTSHAFLLPALLQAQGNTLSQRAQAWGHLVAATEEKLADIQAEIDRIAFELYGISPEDIGSGSFSPADPAETTEDDSDDDDDPAETADLPALVEGLLEYSLGVAFGRFDLRLALGERDYPAEPEPFDPLPACSPGLLVTEEGLPPATAADLPPGYPLALPFNGILTEDEGHAEDVVQRIQQVMACLWGDGATDIEQEAMEVLNSPSLRAYLTKGSLFFGQHIKRYSKSRRKAPIYWQLAIPSVKYSVWLYYHRFTKDTFYNVNDYVKLKLDHEERKLAGLTQDAGPTPSASQRKDIAAQEAFVAELRTFRDEVAIIAPLWNPNLNDGVIINFAPLWRLVPHHKPWQKECKACWEKLIAGDYDWAHLAMHLWPERVIPKCQTDRSLAIAHTLEADLWQEDPTTHKWHPRTIPPETLNQLIQQRTSPAVKDALQRLQNAPTPSGSRPRKRRS